MTQVELKALPYWERIVEKGRDVRDARAALVECDARHARLREALAKRVQDAELAFLEAEGPGGAL